MSFTTVFVKLILVLDSSIFVFADRCVQLVDASLVTVQTIYLKLSEADANVPTVTQKNQEQIDTSDEIVLTDCKGQEIHDSQGTQSKYTTD